MLDNLLIIDKYLITLTKSKNSFFDSFKFKLYEFLYF